jgi:hypothetical protein
MCKCECVSDYEHSPGFLGALNRYLGSWILGWDDNNKNHGNRGCSFESQRMDSGLCTEAPIEVLFVKGYLMVEDGPRDWESRKSGPVEGLRENPYSIFLLNWVPGLWGHTEASIVRI